MPTKVHPVAGHGLPAAHGKKKLRAILRRGHEPNGIMSESRFREVWLEAYDASAADAPWSLRNNAADLLLYVTAKCFACGGEMELETYRQSIPEREAAAREKGCRLHWALEVARRGREQREQQQREQQQRGTHAGDACDSLSKASKTAELLNEYACPITAETMTDPVCTLDGFTYERTAITEWLRTNDTSPATGAKLESKTVIPNITVRCLLRHL